MPDTTSKDSKMPESSPVTTSSTVESSTVSTTTSSKKSFPWVLIIIIALVMLCTGFGVGIFAGGFLLGLVNVNVSDITGDGVPTDGVTDGGDQSIDEQDGYGDTNLAGTYNLCDQVYNTCYLNMTLPEDLSEVQNPDGVGDIVYVKFVDESKEELEQDVFSVYVRFAEGGSTVAEVKKDYIENGTKSGIKAGDLDVYEVDTTDVYPENPGNIGDTVYFIETDYGIIEFVPLNISDSDMTSVLESVQLIEGID